MSQPLEILIETVQIGASLRVTAIDAATGTEVVFQAPANAGQETIRRIAIDKMKFVMAKKNNQ